MDGSQFPPYIWDGSSETQRRPLPLSTGFTDYDPSAIPSMDPTGFFAHPVPPDLFPFHPELPASASWDGTSASSWLPASNRTSGTTAQSSPSGMILFPAFSQQPRGPLPPVQVQEIYLMGCRSHLLRQQLMWLRTLQARGVHLLANARKRSRLPRLPALSALPANVGRSSRIHWLGG
ncbi:hypothetical protein B0H13DRAFT_1985698 [Mycena leptocephala]|nr:hypothetical protein B0H13DRAFT_1985698 [Mycena leptocephala]